MSKRAKRGVSLLWIIIAFPALILFLVFAVEIGNIWLARLELEQSLEASALAAVKEWAEGGMDTKDARIIGNDFAIANPVRGVPVDLTMQVLNVDFDGDLNYDMNQINGNKVCTDISDYGNYLQSGVFVFGVIRETEGPVGPPAGSVIFNAAMSPNCSTGGVLVDATGEGNLNTQHNEWGISFLATEDNYNTSLRIWRVEIDVDSDAMNPSNYHFQVGSAQLAVDGTDPYKINYTTGMQTPLFQTNNNFLTGRNTTVAFSYLGDTLRLDFSSSGPDTNLGLAPGERIRFGANVLDGTSQVDGTEVADVTEVRVYFSTGNVQNATPEIGIMLQDTTGGATAQCRKRAEDRAPVLDALMQEHVVGHELPIIDLPCPPNSGVKNGQSWVQIGGGGAGLPFAVRAQATIGVQSVVKSICGFDLGPWGVSAKSTAYYDCETRDPKLIRVDVFECVDPMN
ncbi:MULTISPECIES: TadE/TadG family type IV pilus assembly protein [Pirellulaceae]|uniref:TadE/TadG family type IV pilus assembly protein n=1 Tax=Pirellulaceae TaxID=2691357 RepID=UPI0013050466|nr:MULTISPECIES: Tad domain-containing protein [Pirellulaceae]